MELYNILEKIFIEEKLMGTKVALLEDIVNGKPKFGRCKYTINEIEINQGGIQFWVGRKSKCITISLINMLITLSCKKLISEDYLDIFNTIIVKQLKNSKNARLQDGKFLALFDIIN